MQETTGYDLSGEKPLPAESERERSDLEARFKEAVDLDSLNTILEEAPSPKCLTDKQTQQLGDLLKPYLDSEIFKSALNQVYESEIKPLLHEREGFTFAEGSVDSLISKLNTEKSQELYNCIQNEIYYHLLLATKSREEVSEVLSCWIDDEFRDSSGFSPYFLLTKAKTDTEHQELLKGALDQLRSEHVVPMQTDLEQLYGDIEYKNYLLSSETQAGDDRVLSSFISPGDKVLDVGCGPGRMLPTVARLGGEYTGLDMVDKHLEQTKKAAENLGLEVQLQKEDWKHLPEEIHDLDVAFCFGRGLLHNLSAEEFAVIVNELRRCVKKGGKIIFDIPDSESGEYSEKIMKTSSTLGGATRMPLIESGIIYDGPDKEHLFWRRVPSKAEILRVAEFLGLRPVGEDGIYLQTFLSSSAGEANANIDNYYVFEVGEIPEEVVVDGGTNVGGLDAYLEEIRS